VVLGKLIFAKLVRKFPTLFAKNEGLLPRSQEPFFGPYPDPYKSTSTMHFNVHFNIILQIMLEAFKKFPSFCIMF